MIRVVAFTAPIGSGKSEAARALKDSHNLIKFADPLKQMLRAFYRDLGINSEEIERRIEGDLKEIPDKALCGQSPRRAMITLGTEWGRNLIHSDLWIHALETKIRSYPNTNFVLDDVRFENEADAVRRLGGKIVRIVGRGGSTVKHESENGIAQVDFTIENSGSVEDLHDAVNRYVRVS
jgi:hypothetical protein